MSLSAQANARAAAKLLFQARRAPFMLHDIPKAYRPDSLDQAYACQAELEKLYLAQQPQPCQRIGYKAANTNKSSQTFLKLDEPFFGPLLASNSIGAVSADPNNPIKIKARSLNLRLCEPEIALLVGENLEIVAVAPALEIVHSSFLEWRHRNVGAYSLIADLACSGAWVRGRATPITSPGMDLDSISCQFTVKNGTTTTSMRGESSRVRPKQVYEQLLTKFRPKAGDWISTGVICDPPYHFGARGDLLLAEFDHGLGSVAVLLE